jgi:hypothetical protein
MMFDNQIGSGQESKIAAGVTGALNDGKTIYKGGQIAKKAAEKPPSKMQKLLQS